MRKLDERWGGVPEHMMSSHFDRFAVRWLADAPDARTMVASGRASLPLAIRGRDVIQVFSMAMERWKSEQVWRSRAIACIEDFAQGHTTWHADPALLDAIPMLLDPKLWQTRLDVDLGLPRALDAINEGHRTEALLAYRPLGVILHISPGNSYLGGIESLLHGLVTGNHNIVKLSRNAPAVAAILIELLESCGLPKGQAQLVLWPSGDDLIESALCKMVDGVVAWGNDDVIRHYKARVPSGVRVLEYGPKLSFSVMTAQARYDEVIDALVEDACGFEQVSCVSSQFLLLQIPHGEDAGTFREQSLHRMAAAFARYAGRFPLSGKNQHEHAEMLTTWDLAKLARSQGRGDFVSGYPDWLLLWEDDDAPIQLSSSFRTWRIYPYRDEEELMRRLAPIRHSLQTASVACGASELKAITERLWAAGVQRVVDPGRANMPMAVARHEGGSTLAGMCRVVSLESPKRRNSLWKGGNNEETLSALQALAQWAKRAPFYARRFSAAGIGAGIEDWDAFHKLPWLTKDDFYIYGPPRSSDLLTVPYSQVRGAYLFTTGGSTGEPKYALYTRDEWDEGSEIFCRTMEAVGITSEDRVANLFNAGGLWSAFLVVNNGLEKLGCLNLPIGGATEPGDLLHLLKSLGATAIYGLPSVLLRLAQVADANPALAAHIPKVVYAGEHMSDAMRDYIRKVFGSQFVRSPLYASVDAGCIGYQCEFSPNGVFHALESYAYVEICDGETGQPVACGDEGEIIVTNFSRRLFPILRVRTGDRGYRLREPCTCGASNFRFRLLGRSDDMVRVGGANVHVTDVDRLCQRFSNELSLVYQLRIDRIGVNDRYELCIETKHGLNTDERNLLAVTVTDAYLEIADEVREYLADGILLHFNLSLLSPGALRGNEKTGKVRRVVDSR
ncbi:aldehyde dehydrogenase family protein [Trinickia terrae]|uniref:long-chain-fatty-acyl-CoA reductase n=1 Tax=Trinickia terrae TaxID=2571161 RepID=A0A4U1I197_9BURK|nr:aldehyde dehydrogenase family protein [Trinickia terrae]TKC86921.1 aldehyde dehydrogenase family protein [Trinickia terrae]